MKTETSIKKENFFLKKTNISLKNTRDGKQTHEKITDSIVVREILIRTTMQYFHTPIRMAKFKNKVDISRLATGTFMPSWWNF